MVVSTISLSLTDRAAVVRPSDWVALIYAAFAIIVQMAGGDPWINLALMAFVIVLLAGS